VILDASVAGIEWGDILESLGTHDGPDEPLHGEGFDVFDHLQEVLVVVVEPTAADQLPDDVERGHVEEVVHLQRIVLI